MPGKPTLSKVEWCRRPFFAVTKVASRTASSQSSSLRSSNCPSSFRQSRNQTPRSSHLLSRRQQVAPSGHHSCISRHLAPARRIHSMPSRRARFEVQGPLVHPWDARGRETTEPGSPTALRSTTHAASSYKKLSNQPAWPQSHSLEAEPIYATSSRHTAGTISKLDDCKIPSLHRWCALRTSQPVYSDRSAHVTSVPGRVDY
jgi:hypothetical protein